MPTRSAKPNWTTETWDEPSEATGGDFCLRHADDRTLRILVGDVSGHGAAAAPIAAAARRLLLPGVLRGVDAALLRRWNRTLQQRFPSNFVCLTYVELDLVTGVGRVFNAGNPSVLVRRGRGEIERFHSNGMALGMVEDEAWIAPDEQTFRLAADDALMCFTDGLTERIGLGRHMFGLDRVVQALSARLGGSPMRTLRRWIARFAWPEAPQDDLTVFWLKPAHAAAA